MIFLEKNYKIFDFFLFENYIILNIAISLFFAMTFKYFRIFFIFSVKIYKNERKILCKLEGFITFQLKRLY